MRYVSTRGEADPVDFRIAMITGLAPDGGLYLPAELPTLPSDWSTWSYQAAVTHSLEMFGAHDAETAVIGAAARFDHAEVAPVNEVGERVVLELFWGPTLSFKDHALELLARLLDRELEHGTILVATSGDTGAAAVEACRQSKHLDVVVLFPEGMVSEFQRLQMTTVPDENVTVVAVRGTFDDCQALVKDAFATMDDLFSVNSINWARIAAQVGYYIHAGARIGEPFDAVVPTGNFGNAYSCWVAKQLGVPIETITIANNANRAIVDRIQLGVTRPAEVVHTSAPAMDIRVPSNLERFTRDLAAEFEADWSSDEQIRDTIAHVDETYDYLIDPHTATAWRAGSKTRTDRPQLVVATAHPAKFSDTVEAAIGRPLPLPDALERLLDLDERYAIIAPDPSELASLIR